jgi:hypothetical protein
MLIRRPISDGNGDGAWRCSSRRLLLAAVMIKPMTLPGDYTACKAQSYSRLD